MPDDTNEQPRTGHTCPYCLGTGIAVDPRDGTACACPCRLQRTP